ncbi:MAG: RdgB/HAM1 family non-canonical purine NTP pyrophosphatase [Verrucomicrobiota bacterium JB023]|nr:RdgB/HAM1 family non-canonical purine NTP pyrophosphatase [Verrucomicrobiota bacterium JB023]
MSEKLRRLVVATRNRKKTAEIREKLAGICEVVDVRGLEEEGFDLPEVEETGVTFLENATLKAEAISQRIGGWVLADDSGLEVDALDGRPGVWSSSFGGEEGNHVKNNEKLCSELASVPEEKRGGRFRCVMVLASGGQKVADFAGSVEGTLLSEARGEEGFGYDPHFIPDGFEQTFAELGIEVKNRLSHRAKALEKVVSWLRERENL